MKLHGCCLCALPSRCDESPDGYGLSLGCLDTNPDLRPAMHIHVASIAPWFEITDALPRYEEGLPR